MKSDRDEIMELMVLIKNQYHEDETFSRFLIIKLLLLLEIHFNRDKYEE